MVEFQVLTRPVALYNEVKLKNPDSKFPGRQVVRTWRSHCRGLGFSPWSGNQDPASHKARPKKKQPAPPNPIRLQIFFQLRIFLSLSYINVMKLSIRQRTVEVCKKAALLLWAVHITLLMKMAIVKLSEVILILRSFI